MEPTQGELTLAAIRAQADKQGCWCEYCFNIHPNPNNQACYAKWTANIQVEADNYFKLTR